MSPLSKKLTYWTLATILTIGIFLRIWIYSHHDSFWKDEIGLASNFLTHDLGHIHEPLQNGQAAPIGFCQISKLAEMIGGHNERVFWLLPLIAGVGMLFLAAAVFQKQFPNGVWLIMLAELAFDRTLITYSCIFKPYIVDAFCAVLMVGAFLHTNNKNENGAAGRSPKNNSPARRKGYSEWDGWTWLIYTLAGILCLYLSYASIFVIAGLGLWRIIEAALKKDRQRFLCSLAANLFIAAIFLWLWQTNYCHLDSHGFFKNFWISSFAPLTLEGNTLSWYANNLGPTLGNIFGQSQWSILLFFAAIGALKARKENRSLLALLLPIILTFAASWFQAYPIAERLVLFWAPLLAPFIALGIYALWKILREHYKGMHAVFVLCVALPLLYPTICQFFDTRDFQEIKQTALCIREKAKAGDTVYLHSRCAHLYRYYFKRYPLPQGVVVVDGTRVESQNLPLFVLQNFHGRHLFVLYTEPEYAIDEIQLLRAAAEQNNELLARTDLILAGALELQVK